MTTPSFVSMSPLTHPGFKTGLRLLCPPDKSITHRSIIFAAMAKGRSTVAQPLLGADCLATINAFRALGVTISIENSLLCIDSPGMEQWSSPLVPLDCGNSGTTARLLSGLLAARAGLFVTMFGDQSLSRRPMGRVIEPLRQAGADIRGRDDGRLLPVAINGQTLKALTHQSNKASAQVKSAILFAGLSTSGETIITLPAGSRDHTERMLAQLGAPIKTDISGHGLSQREHVSLKGPFIPAPGDFRVPGDPSSAAFFAVLVAAACEGELTIEGMLDNPTRTGFVEALKRLGVPISKSSPQLSKSLLEPVVDLNIRGGGDLKAIDLEPELAPTLIDEVPILATLCVFASGTSRLRGLAELRVKESDRLQKTAELLNASGAVARIEGDDLIIEGDAKRREGLAYGLEPFCYDPAGDHRLAMSAAVLAKFAKDSCKLADPDCVDVSFPGFFEQLAALG